jgi:hypothetical protein
VIVIVIVIVIVVMRTMSAHGCEKSSACCDLLNQSHYVCY